MCATWCYVRHLILDTDVDCFRCSFRQRHAGRVCGDCRHLVSCRNSNSNFDCLISWREVGLSMPACCHWEQPLGEVQPEQIIPWLLEDYGGRGQSSAGGHSGALA